MRTRACRSETFGSTSLFQFINRLSEAVPLGKQGEDGFAFPEDTRALQRHLCVCQLSRALGLHHSLNAEGKLRLITELKARYRHGLKFGKSRKHRGENLPAGLRIRTS